MFTCKIVITALGISPSADLSTLRHHRYASLFALPSPFFPHSGGIV